MNLERLIYKLKDIIFCIDCSKKESKTINLLLNKVYDDLKSEKHNNEYLIKYFQDYKKEEKKIIIDFSGSKIIQFEDGNETIYSMLNKNIFFNRLVLTQRFYENKRNIAKKVIEEFGDVSSLRKIFFNYTIN